MAARGTLRALVEEDEKAVVDHLALPMSVAGDCSGAAAVRLDVAQGRRVRACSVHHSADVPFMVSAERTVDCIDGGQPTNERYGVKLAMAQRINMAPDSIDMYCPSHDHDRRANATLAAPNGAGALARRPGVGGLRRCGDSLQPSPGPHGARRHALLRCSGRAGAGRATA